MVRHTLPTQDRLRQRLDYNRATGWLIYLPRPRSEFRLDWHFRRWNTCFSETRAGFYQDTIVGSTIRCIVFDNRRYVESRIIFVWMTGYAPHIVDHVDHDPTHNAWHNLRAATQAENAWNARLRRDKKQPLPRGVNLNYKKFSANIKVNGVRHHLGSYKTPDEASAAYQNAAREFHGKFLYEE